MLDEILKECGFTPEQIQISDVVVSKSTNTLSGKLIVNDLIPISSIRRIITILQRTLKMNVDFDIHFSCYNAFVAVDNSDFILDLIGDYNEQLGKTTVTYEDGTYLICADEDLMDGFLDVRWLVEIQSWFEDMFENSLSLEFYDKKRKRKKDIDDIAKSATPVNENMLYGKSYKGKEIPIKELTFGKAIVKGSVFAIDTRDLPNSGKTSFRFGVKDSSGAVTAKLFCDTEIIESSGLKKNLQDAYVTVYGNYATDTYTGLNYISVRGIEKAVNPNQREDHCSIGKRAELHLHTQMSSMDGIIDVKKVISLAESFGHPALAITDHGVVQSFPDAYSAAKGKNIKIIYGVEGYLLDDENQFVSKCDGSDFDNDIVVFDIETTGLDFLQEKITEIGAVKIRNGKIEESFHSMVNPQKPIPPKIVKLTGITNAMVKNAPLIEDVLDDFYEFCKGCNLCAHNSGFDTKFIYYNDKHGRFNMPVIDTLSLSRVLLPNLKNHKLDTLTKYFNIVLENHHRADNDAKATGELLLRLIDMLKEENVNNLAQCNQYCSENGGEVGGDVYHVILLAKDVVGLSNLYKLVSVSHLDYFYKKPRIPKSVLSKHREGLLVGSACEQGELYQAIIKRMPSEQIKRIAGYYDYLEIQPTGNNMFLVRKGKVDSEKELQDINLSIYNLGKELNKPVVATCDAHFMNKEDQIFRQVLMAGQGFSDGDEDTPIYFRTTNEMLREFAYMGEEAAKEVVIDNTNLISDMCNVDRPFLDGKTYTPSIEGAEDEITKLTYDRAYELYGDELPEIVQKRIDKELNSICGYGYAVLYLIAQKLVKKSMDDGYLVGSRGSVGSSFVAYLSGITEVNPLEPHYICKHCKTTYFDADTDKYPCGKDLPDRVCDKCGQPLFKDGYDIPFEVFLGFKGDKVPDIDLNFSGEYQPKAHKYIEELFGQGHVFRAGTVSTLQDKTAYGFVRKYEEERGLVFNDAYRNWLVAGCVGVKRTTGQHPGGIVIVPKDYEVYDFTPIQHPADSKEKGVVTTHFDFNSMHDILVKVDALGHDDPTMLRALQDATGVDPKEIPLDDKKTMSIFSSTAALGLNERDINSKVGTFGIPEFGTPFVRGVLVDTMPRTMAELVRISGLSHGTDVWTNNAQNLVRKGECTLNEAICTRDDIMNYLIRKGVDSKIAFDIMEKVRKGKGKQLPAEYIEAMENADVAPWYVDSCRKIGYMFPKAHAAAYVMMAFRIAWFKVHKPEYYYAAYFSRNIDDFNCKMLDGGVDAARLRIEELNSQNNLSVNDKAEITLLEMLIEMQMRGFNMLPIDLYKSKADKFYVEEEGIRMPFRAISGLGDAVADAIVEEREKKRFISIEDFRNRTKINKTVVEFMKNFGYIGELRETNQLSFF